MNAEAQRYREGLALRNHSVPPCLCGSINSADTSALESEIDEKVFDLYNLTPEEREIVKGGGK